MPDKQTIIQHLVRPVVSGPANFLNEEETREFARAQRRIISYPTGQLLKGDPAGGFTNLGSLEYWLHQSNCRK